MIVELVSVGTEILLGNIVNTNAAYLATKCAALGLSMYNQSVVGDNEERLDNTIKQALSRSDIVIITGGLGPTQDDLTKETAARHMGFRLVEDMHTRKRIEEFFKDSIYTEIPENNWKQAIVPDGATVIDNNNGMAPGLIMEKNNKILIMLPGPPNELYPMFEHDIYPYLASLNNETIYSETVKIAAFGESQVEDRIIDLIDSQTNPTIATYAKTSEVHIRITAKNDSEEDCKRIIEPVKNEIISRFGEDVLTCNEKETLEECLVNMLKEKHYTVTTAESCTGGKIASNIVNVSGVSSVLNSAFVTYSAEAKMEFAHVEKETIDKYTVVSEQTAYEMAKGAAETAHSNAAMSVTGIAGPLGGTKEQPVGLVYIGCYLNGKVSVARYVFKGNREKVREQAVYHAMNNLRKMIISEDSSKN